MEYMDLDIKKLIQNEEPANFNNDHLKTIFYNLLCAVNFIHTSGVMHRDLKPGNILIDKQCFVRICDFGMARTCPGALLLKKKGKKEDLECESTEGSY